MVGVQAACAVLGVFRASYYRQQRPPLPYAVERPSDVQQPIGMVLYVFASGLLRLAAEAVGVLLDMCRDHGAHEFQQVLQNRDGRCDLGSRVQRRLG